MCANPLDRAGYPIQVALGEAELSHDCPITWSVFGIGAALPATYWVSIHRRAHSFELRTDRGGVRAGGVRPATFRRSGSRAGQGLLAARPFEEVPVSADYDAKDSEPDPFEAADFRGHCEDAAGSVLDDIQVTGDIGGSPELGLVDLIGYSSMRRVLSFLPSRWMWIVSACRMACLSPIPRWTSRGSHPVVSRVMELLPLSPGANGTNMVMRSDR
ncbi:MULTISPECIES: hypothetical protein [unclassified Rhodococcus (in: high G+C Gram-positive bacteria)]|uniref:hypothetical protein n=1 Tax=unclassified Rhodococcus (in: high G+C Gram-positive bacteria) TaxID=192944 RepID=UPI001CBB01A2|nr:MULTISPECIES: hypothetical protein [unclassified Rhodococcus (in: high G+C Gram-positive bacteria)]